MRCPQCNKENPVGARFCLKCGAELALLCPQCEAELPLDPDLRFCPQCGTEVAAPPVDAAAERNSAAVKALKRVAARGYAERLLAAGGQVKDERRIVTILFSDVKGSTAMAENLDPEDVMEIMDGAFDVLIEPIYRYEGTLARLMGDAILAFFGAPIAHEDDPERACRAALEIIAGAQEYGKRLEQERGITGFNVRVGINTGLVVVGEVGSDLRVEYTAMGDAINLAARMESSAQPGTVVVSEDTHKLIAPLFETEALGPVQVKGKTQPVPVYHVLAAKEVPGKVRGIAGLESPLVGREAEFAALQEAMERLQAGIGGIVTLVGEAGLGKSRLVAETRRVGAIPRPTDGETSHELPLQWVEGRCLSYGTSIAYLLWLDVLRGLLGTAVEDPVDAVGEALSARVQAWCPEDAGDVHPYLARLMSLPLSEEQQSRLDDLDGQQLKAGTFRAVETLVESAARQQALVIVCEDLHWADPTSIELLESLLALSDRSSVLFICIFRPEKEHGSWRIKENAARMYGHSHTDLWLHPLSPGDSERLVGNLLEVEALPEALRDRILHVAEGNPFYVEEILRSLIDQEAIVHDEATGRWRAIRQVADVPIPDTLQGVLIARIDRLQEEAKRVLQMASVIGRIFLYRVLGAIAEEERELDAQLLTLQREQMIRTRARIPELEYIFKHELTREAAYNGLLKKERRVFHRQVAEALERLFPERIEEQLGLLAHHWERGGEAEKATDYLQRAGDQARLMFAQAEAISYYERALALLEEEDQCARAARTWMKLGLTHQTAFDFEKSRHAYEQGFVLWQRAAQAQPDVLSAAPHALREGWYNPHTLDSAHAYGGNAVALIGQLFSGLVRLTPQSGIIPEVAQRWDVSADGRRYVFHFREGISWSDGAPLTAADFAHAWRRVLDPATKSPRVTLLYDIKGARAFHRGETANAQAVGVRARDERTLEIELEAPTGHFLMLLADPILYPVPRHVIERHGEAWTDVENIVCNGPFCLEAYDPRCSIRLTRNPHYAGRFDGNVETVELSLLETGDWSTALKMYDADEADVLFVSNYPPESQRRLRQRHPGDFVAGPGGGTYYLAFNVGLPPLDDVRVRQALVYATDREALARPGAGGSFAPAGGGFVPPGMPGHAAGIALPYDPERARRLLAAAGYSGDRRLPALTVLGFVGARAYLGALQAQWQDNLGTELQVEITEWPDVLARVQTDAPHAYIMGWDADYPDPDSFLREASLLEDWHHARYAELVARARQLTDPRQRMDLYQEAERILVEQAPLVPLLYDQDHLLVKPWVTRYPTSPIQRHFWQDVIIEPH